MKPVIRQLLACALLAVLFAAQAQGDEVVERYDLALANLSESVNLLSSDVAASRDELDRAAGALRFLASRSNSSGLVGAMERVFERARTAIQNRSATDLGVQTAVLRGGFRRALYDSALALDESESATAAARIERLARDLGLSEEVRQALANAGDDATLRREFEASVAERLREQLQAAAARYRESKDDAYRQLAEAYGTFLLIQDSPLAGAGLNADFAAAVDGLVEDRADEFEARIADLGDSFARLAAAAREQETEPQPDVEPQEAPDSGNQGATPVQDAAETGITLALPDAPGGGNGGRGDLTAVAQAPGNGAPSGAPQTGAISQDEAAAQDEVEAQDVAADQEGAATQDEVAEEQGGAERSGQPVAGESAATASEPTRGAAAAGEAPAGLRRELILAGVPAVRAETLATELRERGVESLALDVERLYVLAGRAVASLQVGDATAARRALVDFDRHYRNRVGPALSVAAPAADASTARLTRELLRKPVIRLHDTAVLLAQVDAVAGTISGRPVPVIHSLNAETTLRWAGWLRLAILATLMLLALVPLYLLNLAFGGGNRNWQFIGVALFLLLLPAIYEGLALTAALAGEFIGVKALSMAAAFSIFEGPLPQLAWAVTTAAAVLFASIGLYGICVQFGLLGAKKATRGDVQMTRAAESDADTVVDWDEEF